MHYRLDSHTHTLASGHAYNTISEMAQKAAEKKLELLAITEHSMTMPGTCHEFYFLNLKTVPRTMYGIELLLGTELNIIDYDGKVDMRQGLLERMDVAIASLHTPCIRPGTVAENTRALVKAMDNPCIGIIGHPDDGRYPVDYDTLAAAAKEKKVLLELNNHSLDANGARVGARENDIKMLECCMKYKTPVILDSDAHWADDIANCTNSLPLIQEMGFPEELIVNSSLEEYKKYVYLYQKTALH
ncbi:MAG: phosphatase [Lachnospiraceae bacterium]|nr:phosphatase [Lachnospiraceae bacterium]